jgi:glycosyltransferase involved in cell wall biosynthesis
MKISILTPNLSHNCLGRAYVLAKMLQDRFSVEIVGPLFGREIWEPVAGDKSIPYKSVPISWGIRSYGQIANLARRVDGDIIYASKPLYTSYLAGLWKKAFTGRPLILDIDDWQFGFRRYSLSMLSVRPRLKYLFRSALYGYTPWSFWNSLVLEKLTFLADQVTVANPFLRRRFGGTIIPHARDTEVLDPAKLDKSACRKRHAIGERQKVIMFLGTPRPHKGLEDLVEAVRLGDSREWLLVLVGVPPDSGFEKMARQKLPGNCRVFGPQPFERAPEFLAMADVVVIPQKKNSATVGQTPAKIFDAMAMAKPVVATRVSNIPEVLDGCGWVVEPGHPENLASAIQSVLDNPRQAEESGRRARQKCIEQYSHEAVRPVLAGVLRKYEH